MSLPVSSVRDMSNERRARRAESSADTTLRDAIRRALAGGHPLSLLSLASLVIHVAKPEPLISLKSGRCDTSHLDRVLTGLIGVRNRETTALLAVIAELLVDDPAPQLRCRRELAERGEHLPQWITALPQVEVYRAVRRTNVFGDVDELVIGMRLDGGHELTDRGPDRPQHVVAALPMRALYRIRSTRPLRGWPNPAATPTFSR